MALSGMANAHSLVGSWICYLEEPVFLVSFNLGGTFTASDNTGDTSVNYGVWERSGSNTFISTDFAFIFNSAGSIQKTNASIVMSDNDNLTAYLNIDGVKIATSCYRIQVDTDS
jgi:hypothetical protein